MLALIARARGSAVAPELIEVPEPTVLPGELLVESLALGVCGTDRSMLARETRGMPAGRDRIVVGHESLGRVLVAPEGSGYAVGDLVAGVVRRPDPVPCPRCADGEIDLCMRHDYLESGIASRDGYGSQRYALDPAFAVRVEANVGIAGVLVEPASIVAKVWERVDSVRAPGGRALVIGAGPIGLLTALFAVQRGYDVHVVDRVADGPKPERVRELGATYHQGLDSIEGRFEAVIECAGQLVGEAIEATAATGVTCLVAGVYSGAAPTLDLKRFSADLVGGNKFITAISSSNHRHFQGAQEALAKAPEGWAARLLTRISPLERYADSYAADPDGIKSVVQFKGWDQ